MNTKILKQYIEVYKQNFEFINNEELYKWKAVKHFKNHWDIEARDFPSMLSLSFKKTVNLIQSGQYFPLKMIKLYAEKEPETVREAFWYLFNLENDIEERIVQFQNILKLINDRHSPEKSSYQDKRAVSVYLTLRYPEIYYFYKYEMYKSFAKKLELAFKPKAADFETLVQYDKICNIIRFYLSEDKDLLKLHLDRLDEECYIDENLHILTQDFIYSIATHFEKISVPETKLVLNNSTIINPQNLSIKNESVSFKGRFVNFIENNMEAKRIGDLGEIWVYEQEILKLNSNGFTKLASQVKHVSNDEGDGTGYDIESFDLDGNKIFIEVKTTKNQFSSPFFISRTELERSKVEQSNYYLYRVFNYDEATNKADCTIIKGDLSNICTVPSNYKVKLK